MLHDLHSGVLLAAAAALSPKLVSLRDLHSGVLWAAAAALSPKLVPLRDLHCGLLLAAAAAAALFPCCWFMGGANAIWGLCRYNVVQLCISNLAAARANCNPTDSFQFGLTERKKTFTDSQPGPVD